MSMYADIVITTKSVLNGSSKVAIVYHDLDDGTWQALPMEPIFEEDAKIISFKTLMSIDSTVKELMSLPRGYKATKKNNTWDIEEDT